MLPLTFRNFYVELLSRLWPVDHFCNWLIHELWRLSPQKWNKQRYFIIQGVILSWSLLSPHINDPFGPSHTQFLCSLQIMPAVPTPVSPVSFTLNPYFLYSESKPVCVHITGADAGVLLTWPTLIVVFLFSDIAQFPGFDFISSV
jgi:hypothetical protein